jgi:2-polyprenyl-3-methyl-5-hydroxy-6-metoxy-1,4-benzoquinol methylase
MSTTCDPLAKWNNAAGHWQGLRLQRQAPRYREIARLVELYGDKGKILDVGCGEGVLLDYLNLANVSQYTGIEASATAIGGVVLTRSQDKVERLTAEQYQPCPSSWDVVVLNEMLYYLRDPAAIIDKFAKGLTKNGVLLISICQKKDSLNAKALARKALLWLCRPGVVRGNRHCTRIIESHFQKGRYQVRDCFEVNGKIGMDPWRIYVVQPSMGS